jgi:hypothetical protein
MSRYMAMVDAENCPRAIARPKSAADWNGGALTIYGKAAPRKIARSARLGTQVQEGDEIWICTDDTGPGIAAFGRAEKVEAASGSLSITLRDVVLLTHPCALSDFPKAESGSAIITQMQGYSRPDIYLLDEAIYDELQTVLDARLHKKP